MELILIIVVLVLLFGGGGGYWVAVEVIGDRTRPALRERAGTLRLRLPAANPPRTNSVTNLWGGAVGNSITSRFLFHRRSLAAGYGTISGTNCGWTVT